MTETLVSTPGSCGTAPIVEAKLATAGPDLAGYGLPKAEKWILVRAGDLEVLSNAREAKVREIAARMEQFRRVLLHLVPTLAVSSSETTRIFLFKNEASMKSFKPPAARGYYWGGSYSKFITLNATPSASTRADPVSQWLNPYTHYPYHDFYHEFTHYILDCNFPRVPAWLDEGLAEYYSTFEVKGDRATLGVPLGQSIISLNSDKMLWIPVDLLMSASRPTDDLLITTPYFYLQSWATVHYLLHGSAQRQDELFRYFT